MNKKYGKYRRGYNILLQYEFGLAVFEVSLLWIISAILSYLFQFEFTQFASIIFIVILINIVSMIVINTIIKSGIRSNEVWGMERCRSNIITRFKYKSEIYIYTILLYGNLLGLFCWMMSYAILYLIFNGFTINNLMNSSICIFDFLLLKFCFNILIIIIVSIFGVLIVIILTFNTGLKIRNDKFCEPN